MVGSQPTLIDILQSQQFRLAALLAMGLEHTNVAYFLEVSEQALMDMLAEILSRTGCSRAENLTTRLLFESSHDLFEPTRLQGELDEMQKRASELLRGLPRFPGSCLEL